MAAYVVAVLMAITLAIVELRTRLVSRPTFKRSAVLWWIGRIVLEGGLAGAATYIVSFWQIKLPIWVPRWLALGLIGGVGGPAVARSAVATIRKGKDQFSLGLAAFYEPVRDWIESNLDEIGAAEQGRWITEKVIPALEANGVSPQDLASRFKLYLNGLSRLSDLERAEVIDFLNKTLADPSTSDPDKIEVILQRALALRAHRWIQTLL